jgi:hypothetical protein
MPRIEPIASADYKLTAKALWRERYEGKSSLAGHTSQNASFDMGVRNVGELSRENLRWR